MSEQPIFVAAERFRPEDGDSWGKYIAWAKLPQLVELITLDCALCPQLPEERIDEDWPHIVQADFRLDYFHDLPYLLGRVRGRDVNTLGFYRNHAHEITDPPAEGFVFVGHDLIDEQTKISALTNCGGFADVFRNEELNRFGLLQNFGRAKQVHEQLRIQHPEDQHTQCELYSVWRLASSSLG